MVCCDENMDEGGQSTRSRHLALAACSEFQPRKSDKDVHYVHSLSFG